MHFLYMSISMRPMSEHALQCYTVYLTTVVICLTAWFLIFAKPVLPFFLYDFFILLSASNIHWVNLCLPFPPYRPEKMAKLPVILGNLDITIDNVFPDIPSKYGKVLLNSWKAFPLQFFYWFLIYFQIMLTHHTFPWNSLKTVPRH